MSNTKRPKVISKYNRIWLNPDRNRMAAMKWYIVYTEGSEHWDAGVEIRDCSRLINLEFSSWEMNEKRKKALDKIDLIINQLQKFRTELEKMNVKTKDKPSKGKKK